MLNRNNAAAIGIIGIIVITFSVAVFFLLDIERVFLNVLALAFLLLSEFIFFGVLIGLGFTGAKQSKVFLRAGITTTLSLYLAATLISLLFAGMFRETPNTFILIELAIIALFAIITISVFACSRVIERRNEEDMAKVGTTKPKRGGF